MNPLLQLPGVYRQPRILAVDFETATIEGGSWGMWNTNLTHVTQPSYILCGGYRWIGEEDTSTVISLRDFPRYRRDKKNDKDVVLAFTDLINQADVVVAHNGKSFDIKKLQARQFKHGVPKCAPFQWVDTLSVARRHFKHESNKLDTLAQTIGVGKKLKHTGIQMWIDVQAGSDEAFDLMERYCGVDVDILVDVYFYLRDGGWISDHPNMSVISGTMTGCPNGCLTGEMKWVKNRPMKTRVAVQYRCTTCNDYATARHDGTKKGPMFAKR